jgi:hypothetical protein
MNQESRREKIEAMLADEPQDQFLRYSLALECEKVGDHDRSLELLEALTQDGEPYVPAFFMSGQQLARLELFDKARSYLRDGIEAARRAGDTHAAGEMSEFLMSLGVEGERHP